MPQKKVGEFGPGPELEEGLCKACDLSLLAPGGTILMDDEGKCLTCGRQVALQEVAQACAPTEIITITEPLKVYLTDAEYKELAIKMGQFSAEVNQAEVDLTAVKSRYKSRKEAAEAKYNEVANIIRSGWEERPVECQLIKNYAAGTITKIRLDTGDEVSTRAMTSEERQRGLAFMEQAEGEGDE